MFLVWLLLCIRVYIYGDHDYWPFCVTRFVILGILAIVAILVVAIVVVLLCVIVVIMAIDILSTNDITIIGPGIIVTIVISVMYSY